MTKRKSHEETLLDKNFEDYCKSLASNGHALSSNLGPEFELFGVEMTTKLSGHSFEDIQNAVIGGSRDGGIDAVAVYYNNGLLSDEAGLKEIEDERSQAKAGTLTQQLTVVFYQMKRGSGLGSAVPAKIEKTLSEFFGSRAGTSHVTISSDLRNRMKFVTDVIERLRIRSSEITFKIRVVSGVDGEHQGEAKELIADIEHPLTEEYPGCEVIFEPYGPKELNDLYEFVDDCNATISTNSDTIEVGNQIIMIPRLHEFFDFITDEKGLLREALFDGNVRAFLGDRIEVNSDIYASLASRSGDDIGTPFWWKNNGITVTCTGTPQKTGSRWTLEEVQIVNGLQTSNVIYNYLKRNPSELEQLRSSSNVDDVSNRVVVKVISTDSVEQRNQIIQATNSQTSVSRASLRATDQVHRSIEQFFERSSQSDLIYDRRKGSAASKGITASRVVQIEELAQSVLSTGLLLPNVAWGSPGSALKDDKRYDYCFGTDAFKLEDYLWMASIYKQASRLAREQLNRSDQNLKFYALMVVGLLSARRAKETVLIREDGKEQLWQIQRSLRLDFHQHPDFADEFVVQLLHALKGILEQAAKENHQESSKYAKGADFRNVVAQRFYDRRSAIYTVISQHYGANYLTLGAAG